MCSGITTFICIAILLVYAVYDFSAIINREHSNFDVSGEAIEYSGSEKFYFETDCAKPSPQCVKYTNLDNLNNYIRYLYIEIMVYESAKYDCRANTNVSMFMWGTIVGDIKLYHYNIQRIQY